MPAVPVSNANQYIPAPGSPVDEACKFHTLHCTVQLAFICSTNLILFSTL